VSIVATDVERSIEVNPYPSGASVDEVQELIRRVEEILETLEGLGDANCDRLRLKLNENASVARDKLTDRVSQDPENGSDSGKRYVLGLVVIALSIATLSGFVIGFLVARQNTV
jgi:ElaB/YqjD/DUF883 family membrane-anchored ribosome-binding protein